MQIRLYLAVTALLLCCAPSSRGQAFFAPGVSSFTPEIGTINTGIVHDVTATVSADRKYVTLGMRAQEAGLIAIREFTINNPPSAIAGAGFVGGVLFDDRLTPSGAYGGVNGPVALGRGRGIAILVQRGMTPILSP
jgi:hypothetical protein